MKYLSKEQYARKFNVDPELFESVEEISKFANWFLINKNKKCEKDYRGAIGGFLKKLKSR